MGYHSFFALQVADYGMTVDEMMTLLDDTLATTKPLYDGLHCWAKNQLAARYKQPAPRLIPAHWIGNRWAQSWPGLVEAASLDPLFKGASPESIVKSAESFYVSLGFPKLPPSFWESSDLYPGAARRRAQEERHASAWHIDREQDVRSLMSVEPNEQWFGTSHHELGHIYYYLAYSRPEVPFLLRDGRQPRLPRGDRRAGAAGQPADALPGEGRPPPGGQGARSVRLAAAVRAGLDRVPALVGGDDEPLRARPLRERAAARRMADRWWDYVAAFQGVTPAAGRDPELCDACTKTHINDDPAAVLRLRAGDADQVPAARPHLHQDPQAGRARVRLLGQQAGGRLPARHPVKGRDPRLADR